MNLHHKVQTQLTEITATITKTCGNEDDLPHANFDDHPLKTCQDFERTDTLLHQADPTDTVVSTETDHTVPHLSKHTTKGDDKVIHG